MTSAGRIASAFLRPFLPKERIKPILLAISLAHLQATGSVIITRVSAEQLEHLQSAKLPEGCELEHNARARTVVIRSAKPKAKQGMGGHPGSRHRRHARR